MARLHEYQGKSLLNEAGIAVPRGCVARSVTQAKEIADSLGGRVVLKAQAWVTGRAALGGIHFADSPDQAVEHAQQLLAMRFGNFPVSEVLIEEAIEIASELFVSLSIDDAAMAPVLLLDVHGGSGIEERADSVARLAVDVKTGVNRDEVAHVVSTASIDPDLREAVVDAIVAAVGLAKRIEARSLEINPLVTTLDGRVMAADCRITIDDYAVFRHPELGIEIARELDHPPTQLERIAHDLEQADHRGTFYFAQLPTDGAEQSKGLIGFHGAGGGGSMMSMDAATKAGFTLANFCDTSGNPSAAKVYRAARIILEQPGIVGYFGSGSGVASQEQYHSAYGLAKAFIEMNISIPAVIRLGGNSEDRAVDVLQRACADLPAPVEGYKKDDTPAFCADRFATLVAQAGNKPLETSRVVPNFAGSKSAYNFAIKGGRVWIDHAACDSTISQLVISHSAGLLAVNPSDKPVLAVNEEDVAGKDSEMIACEIELRMAGHPVVFVDLAIDGIDVNIASNETVAA